MVRAAFPRAIIISLQCVTGSSCCVSWRVVVVQALDQRCSAESDIPCPSAARHRYFGARASILGQCYQRLGHCTWKTRYYRALAAGIAAFPPRRNI
jgi:hypothetical protein